MLRKISIFWIILIALLGTSAIPLFAVSYRAVQSTRSGVEREQKSQLIARVDAHASTIDEQFRRFETATNLAANEARKLLISASRGRLSEEDINSRLAKYQRDANNVLGLDAWYENTYYPAFGDNRQSNVFLNQNTELTPEIAYSIAITEDLNSTFNAIINMSFGTQWIYLTTAEGMMRLYPWQSNNQYPPDWEPQTISFYTVAAPDRNPDRRPVWTAPYNDYAGAGIMVTNSVPIYDRDSLIAVMSQDLLINQLQTQVLNFAVGKQGYAFLLDTNGNIVAHKDYLLDETPLGEELQIKLAEQNPRMQPIVELMLTQGEGSHDYVDAKGRRWLVVYTVIPVTGWHLGMMQPYDEIVEPANRIIDQVATGAAVLVVFILGVSIWLARRITSPVLQLSRTAKEIESSVDAETADAIAPNLQHLANINSAKEINNLASVFEQMVMALQQRMMELDSIYAMGQTITAQVDFDQTIRAVLAVVQQVVTFDAAEVSVVKGEKLIVEAWSGREEFNDTTGREYRMGVGPTGLIAATKAPLLLSTIAGTEQEFQRTLGYESTTGEFLMKTTRVVINSFLGIPLLIGTRVVGTLTLVHRSPGHFTEQDKRRLNKLAAQASIAIDNAIQVRQRENALKEQIRELRVEIDQARLSQQVDEITTTDYFQFLQANAARMRERAGKGTRHSTGSNLDQTNESDVSSQGSNTPGDQTPGV